MVNLLNTHGSYDFVYTYELFKYKKAYDKRPNWISVKNKILGIKVAEENNILIVNLANEDILYAMLKLLISE